MKKIKRNHEQQLKETTDKLNEELNQQKQINMDLKKEINNNNRNHKEELKKTANDFKEKLKQHEQKNIALKMEMSKKYSEYEQKIKKSEDVIQSLDKSVREYDEKEKTCIQNKISAEKEYNESLPQIFEDFDKDEKDSLIEEILKKMSSFLSEKLSLDDLVEEIIPKIAKKEKFSKYIKDFMEEKINSIQDENFDFKVLHFNILIMGNPGVGKSTLLNKILKEDLAKTNFGNACTKGKPKPYESNKAKGIRIWDTRGIEPGNYNISAANNDIQEAIDSLVKENDQINIFIVYGIVFIQIVL